MSWFFVQMRTTSWLNALHRRLVLVLNACTGATSCLESLYRRLLVAMCIWRGGCFLSWIIVLGVTTCCHKYLNRGLFLVLNLCTWVNFVPGIFVGTIISSLFYCVVIVVSGSPVHRHFTRQFLINWEHCLHFRTKVIQGNNTVNNITIFIVCSFSFQLFGI